jgi:hypothetical protein
MVTHDIHPPRMEGARREDEDFESLQERYLIVAPHAGLRPGLKLNSSPDLDCPDISSIA